MFVSLLTESCYYLEFKLAKKNQYFFFHKIYLHFFFFLLNGKNFSLAVPSLNLELYTPKKCISSFFLSWFHFSILSLPPTLYFLPFFTLTKIPCFCLVHKTTQNFILSVRIKIPKLESVPVLWSSALECFCTLWYYDFINHILSYINY